MKACFVILCALLLFFSGYWLAQQTIEPVIVRSVVEKTVEVKSLPIIITLQREIIKEIPVIREVVVVKYVDHYPPELEYPVDVITSKQASDYIEEAISSHKYNDTSCDKMWVNRYVEILKLICL